MKVSDEKIVVSPYAHNQFDRYCVYQAPICGHRPMKDFMFPIMPFVYSSWENEELSWHDNCYIHSGLNPFFFEEITGIEALDLLTDFCISTFKNFPVGKARHAIFCNEKGKIIQDGIIIRRGEDKFLACALPSFEEMNKYAGNKYNIQCKSLYMENFFYQLCGPTSLQIVEAAAKEDLHDIKFMYARDCKIAGKEVFVLRTGMAGTLGYEVHGKIEDAHEVYQALLEAGKEYGITEIGRHAYRNAHTEGSIPQSWVHFINDESEHQSGYFKAPNNGSLGNDSELLFRSPIDVGWEKMISFKHDFIGKDALKAELEGHHNKCVMVRWNVEDILEVVKSYFTDKPADIMDMVEDFDFIMGDHAVCVDAVYDGDKLIGASGGRMYSPKNHEMISMCTVDEDYAAEGTVFEILWGKPGSNQLRVRAEVIPWIYITECRNDNFDVENIPHPVFD